jgi:phosphotransferase system enzyme I (PtsP)
MALIGLGFRSLSMSPAAIGPVKAMALALDAGKLARHLEDLLEGGNGTGVLRPALTAFAESERIPY